MATLYDQFSRPIQAGDIRRPETREISVQQIRDRWSTYPSHGLTPERLASIFRAADQGDVLRQAELFEEMEEKDAHLSSQFQTRKLAVQGLSWEVAPVSDDARDQKIAELCNDTLSGLPDLDDIILDMLDAIPKGYSVSEINWDVSSGRAAIAAINWIHPKKVTFWDSMTPRVLTDEDPVRGVDPPPFKVVYHRYKARSGYDTRAGILRVCAWMYLFKNYAIKDWIAFSEIFGMPIRIGRYEPGATRADKDALLAAIRSIGTDAAGIISKNTEILFIEAQKSSGSGQSIFETLSRFCDAQMSKAILGQTLTSEAGGEKGQGSLALGQVHGDVRQDLIEADCRSLAKTITQQVLRPLVGFNFGWDAPVPRFRFCYEPPEDLTAASGVYKTLIVDIGQPVSQEHVAARFKVPLPKEGETPLAPKPAAAPSPFPPMAAKLIAKEAGAAGPGPAGQQAIDASTRRVLPDFSAEMEAMLRPILAEIERATSLEEIGEKLYSLYPRLDSSRFQALLARAMFASALTGGAAVERKE